MKTTGAREVEVMVVEVCRCWTRPTRSGIGTGIRLCGDSSAAASVALPWVVSMASVAPAAGSVAVAAAAVIAVGVVAVAAAGAVTAVGVVVAAAAEAVADDGAVAEETPL